MWVPKKINISAICMKKKMKIEWQIMVVLVFLIQRNFNIFFFIYWRILFYFQKFEKEYHNQLTTGTVSQETKFHYAWCLVRSNYPADIRKGLILLEQLIKHEANDEDSKRNYLYYLALGNSRIKVSTEYGT